MQTIPGFVDLQVNGFVGVDFSSPELTQRELVGAWRELLSRGTCAFLPTIITSPVEVYRRNIPILVKAMRTDEFEGRVLGLHLEGPFISAVPGAVGAHNPTYVQRANPDLLGQLLDWGEGAVRLLTVAAEIPAVDTVIHLARERDVTVSIGHSMFGAEDLARVRQAGAVALTHLGNGLPNQLPRHPNPIWDGLADDAFTAMIIADGHHLPASVVKTMIRAKGLGRLIVVSDASPVAGFPPGQYEVLGNQAILEPSGRLHNPEKQCLVGSAVTMVDCMNFLSSLDILEPDGLLAVGFGNALRLIGVAPKALSVAGAPLVRYDEGRFSVARV
ncbi:MAG: N-acetylglucosamine-6-phosphate deacetylase [Anaerolineae bacterium]